MKKFDRSFIENFRDYTENRQPDFENILRIANRQKPSRSTLFEFFFNDELDLFLAGRKEMPAAQLDILKMKVDAFRAAGYDYCTINASDFVFPRKADTHGRASLSFDEQVMILDRESFSSYPWPEPEDFDQTTYLPQLAEYLPRDMKIISPSPCGLLENVIYLTGYEGLCYLLADDMQLVKDVFDAVGSRLVRYYELAVKYDCIGAFFANDDWGFNSSTMLSTKLMRELVFPWHKKMVEVIHKSGRPAFLHSCGKLDSVMDNIIDDMKYDGKHSYEDKIQPVEQAYEQYHDRIAILGGLDLDFVCRSQPEEVYDRACSMLERTARRGGYGLGTGNSIPSYVPRDNFFAMISAALVNG